MPLGDRQVDATHRGSSQQTQPTLKTVQVTMTCTSREDLQKVADVKAAITAWPQKDIPGLQIEVADKKGNFQSSSFSGFVGKPMKFVVSQVIPNLKNGVITTYSFSAKACQTTTNLYQLQPVTKKSPPVSSA